MTAKYLMDGIIGWNVEFRDLYNFFAENEEANDFWLTINSPGGIVDEGKRIYDLIKAQSKPVTIEIYSAHSIASAIVLAAPTRLIHPNGEMLIHLPWIDPGPINENDLAELQASFAKAKAQILDIYAKETGADLKELTEVMEAEKMLSADEAISMGFATGYAKETEEVFDRNLKPVFALNKDQLRDKKMNTLEKLSAQLGELLNKKVENLTIALDSGKILEVKTGADDLPQEGHPALIDSQAAEDGEYISAEEGIIYRVENGKIASIEKPQMVEAGKVQEYILNAAKQIRDHFNEEVKALTAKMEDAEATIEGLKAELSKSADEVEALKKGFASNYVPPRKAEDGQPAEKSLYGHYKDIVNNRRNGQSK